MITGNLWTWDEEFIQCSSVFCWFKGRFVSTEEIGSFILKSSLSGHVSHLRAWLRLCGILSSVLTPHTFLMQETLHSCVKRWLDMDIRGYDRVSDADIPNSKHMSNLSADSFTFILKWIISCSTERSMGWVLHTITSYPLRVLNSCWLGASPSS